MTDVRPAADAAAARWLLQPDVDWWTLVRYGPPGFDVYVRIAFRDSDLAPDERIDPVRAALVTLASHTTTPARGYAAIWEGWCGEPPAEPAPRVNIPNREMLLYTGGIEVLRDAPGQAWNHLPGRHEQEPHLVWPEDQAWCLACEVDEEIEFTVGCSREASTALASTLPGCVRQVHYGDPAPMYRDEQ